MRLTEAEAEAADIRTVSTASQHWGLGQLTFEQCRAAP